MKIISLANPFNPVTGYPLVSHSFVDNLRYEFRTKGFRGYCGRRKADSEI